MKKRIATLLALALSTTLLLGGCGASSDTETANNDSNNGSNEILSETAKTKSNLLSECLSEEKVIGYVVDSIDKAETPKNIYFFNGGKVTIIPGKEFGLTMGDFAKMSDDEIWEKYQAVKEAYCESYITQKKEKWQENIDSLNAEMKQSKAEAIWFAQDFAEAMPTEMEDIWSKAEVEGTIANEIIDSTYEKVMEVARQQDFYSEFERFDESTAYTQTAIDSLQSLIDKTDFKYPFVDLPFSFIVFTDSTGNNVQSETMIYPVLTLSDSGTFSTNTNTYETLNFVLGLTRQEQIYDTTYNCIGLKGSGSLLTRETMDIDTLDSKNILIDLSSSEMNELFKDEVASRYE